MGYGSHQAKSESVTDNSSRRLAPVVAGLGLVGEDLIEGLGLLDEDVALHDGLVEKHGLKTHEFEHGEEHAD